MTQKSDFFNFYFFQSEHKEKKTINEQIRIDIDIKKKEEKKKKIQRRMQKKKCGVIIQIEW